MEPLTTHLDRRLPDLVVFDLETTGYYFDEHEIIEIGAVRVSPDLATVRGEFSAKAKPEHIKTANPESLAKNGYSDAGWADARPLATVLRDFVAFADQGLLAGYNVAFDWGFLKAACWRLKLSLTVDYHIFDVMSLALLQVLKSGKPQSVRLRTILQRLGLPPQPEPHRALEDARATLAVLRVLSNRVPRAPAHAP